MNSQMTKNFEPQQVEEKWSRHWAEKAYFNSFPDGRPPFTVVIPPPNVTGVLHMGHTLNETVQDILVRHARMNGFNACWVPGSDHASIATEAKVVQMLEKEKGISKHDLSREEFLKYAFEWKDKYGGIIYEQIRKLGCSVDWNRVTFTMDDHYYKAVIKVFTDLFNKGMIYRGARMINWDPSAKTALSDEEVEYKDVQGKLYYVKYKVKNAPAGSADHIVIATQRPETIMGDTAVCVNPSDEKYSHLNGATVIVPLVNREVPVIFDEYVDPAFGTGALKVTPAHDINDYNLGLKHQLPVIDTLNEDGTLSEAAEVFTGIDRFEARKLAIERLKEEGLLVKEEEYQTRLGFSQRTNAVVEPRISTQWFVKMDMMADKALQAVTSGNVKIHPEERFLATYKYWLENVKDWCISRQLLWGQRIPAWYDPEGKFVVAETKEEAWKKYQTEFTIQRSSFSIDDLKQDEDVFDTWFSSWIWPIEVFNGISNPGNADIKYYYPTNVLVTGQDIIFFWVARMIMSGMEYMNERPFEHVYFTGMVRDKQGRKMSKSLGNSPDLLDLISRFGADAVRFGIMISSPAGNDLLFDESSCDQGRNFNNKIWNALKLVTQVWTSADENDAIKQPAHSAFAIDIFRNQLNQAKSEVEKLYKDFRLSEALKKIYTLVWDDFCSAYLEYVKPPQGEKTDAKTYAATIGFFEELMQLLHPFMPFVTEELYHQLGDQQQDLCVKQYTKPGSADLTLINKGEILKQAISAIKDTCLKNKIKTSEGFQVFVDGVLSLDEGFLFLLGKQTKARQVSIVNQQVDGTIPVLVRSEKFYLKAETALDTSFQREEIQKEIDYLKGFLVSVEKKLGNERFVQNAKPEVVEIERRKKADAQEKIQALEESLKGL
jgi:valyl-tRNA synthetase